METMTPETIAWARKVGIPVGERGRLQAHVWAAYLEQHPEASN